MQGVENIIAMRKRGLKPSMVMVETEPMQKWTKEATSRPGRHVDIHLTPSDIKNIATADLRCLIGLSVVVCGPDNEDTWRVARACKAAQARIVEAFGSHMFPWGEVVTTAHKRFTDAGEVNVLCS